MGTHKPEQEPVDHSPLGDNAEGLRVAIVTDVAGLVSVLGQLDDIAVKPIAPRQNDLASSEPDSWTSLAVPSDVGSVG